MRANTRAGVRRSGSTRADSRHVPDDCRPRGR
jgi:hypothetical protein